MTKLLVFPNDAISAYFRDTEEALLNEVNPKLNGKRFFNDVNFINWKQETDQTYAGIKSYAILDDKTPAWKITNKLNSGEVPFSYPIYTDVFNHEKERILKISKEFSPDMIKTTIHPFGIEQGVIVKKELNIPLITSAHDPTRITNGISELDFLVCESNELKELCNKKYGFDNEKMEIIHIGIDMDMFKPKLPNKLVNVIPQNFLSSPYKIFTSGRLVRGKNIETILESLNLVKNELPGLVHLHLGSDKTQPDVANEILNLKNKLNLQNTCFFLGTRSRKDLPYFYSWADVFVHPSLWEGLSRVVRESLACGTPSITTNYGSATEIVKNNYNGLLVDPQNPEEIAENIIRYFKDNHLRKNLENNARKSVVNKYGIPENQKKWVEIYKKILKNI